MSGLSLGVDDRRSWDEMARKHGTRSDGAFHLPMKIELAIDNEEGLEILPSMPFFPDYTEFTFTYRVEADSGIQLEIYPTEPNTTMLNVGGNGRDPVRLEVLGELPPYLEVSFDPEVVEARLGVSTEPAKWRWP
jgi:hypothetical protein